MMKKVNENKKFKCSIRTTKMKQFLLNISLNFDYEKNVLDDIFKNHPVSLVTP